MLLALADEAVHSRVLRLVTRCWPRPPKGVSRARTPFGG